MREAFRKFAHRISTAMGAPVSFALAVGIVAGWALLGPAFGYSDTWQLVINTGTTIVTFLMVFLIQNTQNRDSRATQLKLDELIRASSKARNDLIDLEDLSDRELDELQVQFVEVKDSFEERLKEIRKTRSKRRKRN